MNSRQLAAERRARMIKSLTDTLQVVANVGKSDATEHDPVYAAAYAREVLIHILTDLGQKPYDNPALIDCHKRQSQVLSAAKAQLENVRRPTELAS